MVVINFNAPFGTAREVGDAFDGIEATLKSMEFKAREEADKRRRWLAMAYAMIDAEATPCEP